MFIDTLEHLVVDEAAGCAAAPGRPDDGGLSRDFFLGFFHERQADAFMT